MGPRGRCRRRTAGAVSLGAPRLPRLMRRGHLSSMLRQPKGQPGTTVARIRVTSGALIGPLLLLLRLGHSFGHWFRHSLWWLASRLMYSQPANASATLPIGVLDSIFDVDTGAPGRSCAAGPLRPIGANAPIRCASKRVEPRARSCVQSVQADCSFLSADVPWVRFIAHSGSSDRPGLFARCRERLGRNCRVHQTPTSALRSPRSMS